MLSARRFKLLSLLVVFMAGCSTVPKETPKGKAVQVIKSPFADTCVQVGRIKYEGTPFIHDKELLIIMKENAAKLSGNALRLDNFKPGVTGVSNAKGLGTAYKCRPSKLRAYLKKAKAKAEAEEYGEDVESEETEDTEGTEEEAVEPAPKATKPAPKAAKPTSPQKPSK